MQKSLLIIISILSLLVLILLGIQALEINAISELTDQQTQSLLIIERVGLIAIVAIAIQFILLLSQSTKKKTERAKSAVKGNAESDQTPDSEKEESLNSETVQNSTSGFEQSLIATLTKTDSLELTCNKFLSAICSEYNFVQGVLSVRKNGTEEFYIEGTYAYYNENTSYSFKIGEGIAGQVAKNQQSICLSNIPDEYVNIVSGLGDSTPNFLTLIPILDKDETIAVLEFASFSKPPLEINNIENNVFKQLSGSMKRFL